MTKHTKPKDETVTNQESTQLAPIDNRNVDHSTITFEDVLALTNIEYDSKFRVELQEKLNLTVDNKWHLIKKVLASDNGAVLGGIHRKITLDWLVTSILRIEDQSAREGNAVTQLKAINMLIDILGFKMTPDQIKTIKSKTQPTTIVQLSVKEQPRVTEANGTNK